MPRGGWVAFFRAVNLGSHHRLSPAGLARELASLGAKNFGAAGTLAFTNASSEREIRAEVARRVEFEPELVVLPSREFLSGMKEAPSQVSAPKKGCWSFVSFLTGPPAQRPQLPLELPAVGPWQLRVLKVRGAWVYSERRPLEPGAYYPNEFVEKAFGVAATTRGWPTLLSVRKHLALGEVP